MVFSRLYWLYYSPLVLSCQAPVLVAVFVFLCTFLCASRYRGIPPDTCRSGLSAVSLWTAQPLARICEQPRQLQCFCRFYGSSCRGDRTTCMAVDSAPLWLPEEALFTCLLFAIQINLRCTRIWILPLLPDKTVWTTMDSAGSDPLRAALVQQGALLGQHATQLNTTAHEMDALNARVAELLTRVDDLQREAANRGPALLAGIPLEPEPHANNPPVYDGDPNSCQDFLSQCSLVFSLQPRRYSTEEAKVAFVLTLLSGRAREWGIAVWRSRAPCCATFVDFCQEMMKLFDRSAQGDETAAQLSRCSVTDYAIQSQTLAAACGWIEGALPAHFLEGLDEAIADELAVVDLPRELDNLINLALRVEGRLNRRRQGRQPTAPWRHLEASSSDAASHLPAEVEPMQLGRLRLTPQQRQERLALGLCLYCGKAGHFVLQCPLKVKAHQWSGESWWVPLPVQTLQLHALSCPFDSPSREVRTLVTPFWIQGLRGISWILPLLWDGTSRPFPWPRLLRRGH